MNKTEFLNELRSKLNGLPQEDLENRLNFYEEMINDRIDEGKSEEEAVNEIGTVDEVVKEIAKDTPLTSLVKEKIKPKRALRVWEIVLLTLGFPLWFPLVLVALILILVAYLLIWSLVIVTYSVELAITVSSVGSFIAFFAYLFNGQFNLTPLGASMLLGGAAVLLFFGCIGATKLTLKLSKSIVVGIKTMFIKKGGNK